MSAIASRIAGKRHEAVHDAHQRQVEPPVVARDQADQDPAERR